MNHPARAHGGVPAGRLGPVAFGEGLFTGIAGDIFLGYLPYPLVMLGIALYTAYRAGHLHRFAFLLGSLTGFLLPSLKNNDVLGNLFQLAGNVLVPLAVITAYYLFSGAHFFATYARTGRAWAITAGWAVFTALWVAFVLPSRLSVMLTPLIWLCFLPLWSAHLRVVHSLLFALVYLAVLRLAGGPGCSAWPLWAAVGGMCLIPELLGRLYPERKHSLDSLPVMTPTLTFRQKLQGVQEVLFLLIDFYALTMEKYKWFPKIVPLGKYIAAAGLILEIVSLFNIQVLPVLNFSLVLVTAGLLLLLGGSDYGTAGICLGISGLALGVGKGFLAGGFQPAAAALGLGLFLLGAVIFLGRPAETKQEREKWRNLNRE